MLSKFQLPVDVQQLLEKVSVIVPESREHLLKLIFTEDRAVAEVAYDVPGQGSVVEATVARCKNGISVNYSDVYMRRRDPECMVIADDKDTDKTRYSARYNTDFTPLRQETLDWLAAQGELIVMPFIAGNRQIGYPSLIIAPVNAAFFVAALADLQVFVAPEDIAEKIEPKAIIYVAPPFRHTHFSGKQVVVHNRLPAIHELFSYNLYPGPSAKKGVYSILLNIGEEEGWITLHCSTVRIITPYEHEFVIMHEGASGGGKSEMIQEIQRETDGRILVGEDIVTGERLYLKLADTCELYPVTDDMGLCHTDLQNDSKKLVVVDAEDGWFLRVDHLKQYGTEPHLEKLTIQPPAPLVFLNLDGQPNATCLIWEHTMDAPGKPCPNPRVIMPRRFIPHIISEPVEVDIRSFGVRTPPTTRETPNYGIIGLLHIIPPSLAWLWRLVAPRGHSNPSIIGGDGLESEGVGSYWPFATGKMVAQANLLLTQIARTPRTHYTLIPNQYIGAYKVGFAPGWIAREYLSRRGSVRFKPEHLEQARCPLLGWTLKSLKVDGTFLPKGLLQVNEQLEVGNEAYDIGAQILADFFKRELKQFQTAELHPVANQIIEVCMAGGTAEDYAKIDLSQV
jgi:Domain of unknown function (DUF4914)